MYHEKLGPNKRIKEKVKQYVNHVHLATLTPEFVYLEVNMAPGNYGEVPRLCIMHAVLLEPAAVVHLAS